MSISPDLWKHALTGLVIFGPVLVLAFIAVVGITVTNCIPTDTQRRSASNN